MGDVPPDGTTDVTQWLWLRQNTRAHVAVGITGVFVGLFGGVTQLWTAFLTGLYISPAFYPAWLGTFDYLNAVFVGLWTTTLIRFGTRDETRYQYRFVSRFRRSKLSDVLIPIGYVAGAGLWGQLLLLPILVTRTTDPRYIAHKTGGTSALEAAIPTVMAAYYGVLVLVFVIYLIGLRYNPVDLDAYDQMVRRILQPRRTTNGS